MSKGFTLIEILIASLLIILFSSSMFYLSRSSVLGVEYSNNYLHGITNTTSILEDIRSMPFDEIMPLNDKILNDGASIIKVSRLGPDICEITVSTIFRKNSRTIDLTTLRSRF